MRLNYQVPSKRWGASAQWKSCEWSCHTQTQREAPYSWSAFGVEVISLKYTFFIVYNKLHTSRLKAPSLINLPICTMFRSRVVSSSSVQSRAAFLLGLLLPPWKIICTNKNRWRKQIINYFATLCACARGKVIGLSVVVVAVVVVVHKNSPDLEI